ncbi:hypothetical protein San01_17480 [Streptomyces angustmyceticus]|uniref:Uncharacterized protein n=1 Tax=Streptomyces angustmyceticus TaxID=285578 RepID=A0A5J4LBN0_9ACTN|nr:hypothetical protein San01_17480 [Streptomyces angustmyceticus]
MSGIPVPRNGPGRLRTSPSPCWSAGPTHPAIRSHLRRRGIRAAPQPLDQIGPACGEAVRSGDRPPDFDVYYKRLVRLAA